MTTEADTIKVMIGQVISVEQINKDLTQKYYAQVVQIDDLCGDKVLLHGEMTNGGFDVVILPVARMGKKDIVGRAEWGRLQKTIEDGARYNLETVDIKKLGELRKIGVRFGDDDIEY